MLEITSNNFRIILHISGQFNCCLDIVTLRAREQPGGISLWSLLMICGWPQCWRVYPLTKHWGFSTIPLYLSAMTVQNTFISFLTCVILACGMHEISFSRLKHLYSCCLTALSALSTLLDKWIYWQIIFCFVQSLWQINSNKLFRALHAYICSTWSLF